MTFERRCTIEPSDFLALLFECATCGAATRIPLSNLAAASYAGLLTRNCLQCGAPTEVKQGTLEYESLIGFSDGLRKIAETASGRNLK